MIPVQGPAQEARPHQPDKPMARKQEKPSKPRKPRPARTGKPLSSCESLIGQTVDPSRLALGWSIEEQPDGHAISGHVARRERLSGGELLKYGVMDFGPGLEVMLHATVETDKGYRITSIDVEAQGVSGGFVPPPIDVRVKKADKELVAAEVGRFLAKPRLKGGKLVEDAKWLEETVGRFDELSQDIFLLGNELPKYHGRHVSVAAARRNGWIVDEAGRTCCGHFELITDCKMMTFWMGVQIQADDGWKATGLKCVLNEEGPPTPEDIEEFFEHELIEGFNHARLTRILDAVMRP